MASSCVSLIQMVAPDTEVVWIGKGAALDLIAKSFPKIRAITLPGSQRVLGQKEFLDQIGAVDLIVDLQTNIRSWILGKNLQRYCGATWVRCRKDGWRRTALVWKARLRGRSRSLPASIINSHDHQFSMMLRSLTLGLNQIGLPVDPQMLATARPLLITPKAAGQTVLPSGTWIALAPGAAHPAKRAPLPKWNEILHELQARLPATQELGFVMLGDKNDCAFAQALMPQLKSFPVKDFTGQLSLSETAQVLEQCQVLLSHDSSLGHIAEAVGRPVGMLFGPTVEAFGFTPWREPSRAFSAPVGCRPCSKHGKTPCRFGDARCFTEIATTDVVDFLVAQVNV